MNPRTVGGSWGPFIDPKWQTAIARPQMHHLGWPTPKSIWSSPMILFPQNPITARNWHRAELSLPPSAEIINPSLSTVSHRDRFHFERCKWSKQALQSVTGLQKALRTPLFKNTVHLIICNVCDNTIYIFIFSLSLTRDVWQCSLSPSLFLFLQHINTYTQ